MRNLKINHKLGRLGNNIKHTLEYIKFEFEKEGYTLLTKQYNNNTQILKYICPKGHKHFTNWANWSQGNRCGFCAKNIKLSLDFIKSEFEKEGYTLLTTEYKNCSQKLKYICPKKHIHSISWSNWKQGNRCHKCSKSNERNHCWKGGISDKGYCQEWTCNLREGIRFRDNEKCQNPFCCSKNPNDLCVHHIDYNKKNCEPSNIITVCRSCNAQANFQRDWWESLYKEVMRRKYGT